MKSLERASAHRILCLLLACASLQACAQTADSASAPKAVAPAKHIVPWLNRPWELRYVLYISDGWAVDFKVSTKGNEESTRVGDDFRTWEALFEPSAFYQSKDKWAHPGQGLHAVLMEFDSDGHVKSPHLFDKPLTGHLDRTMSLMLATGGPGDIRFHLGYWFTGIGDISTHWAPGICGRADLPSPFSKTDTGYLYGPQYGMYVSHSLVGCREWAYQLYDPDRPYIDITSYFPKKLDPDGPGTYVRRTMGWSRFADKPKPVIGNHEGIWYCFHECPNGDKPGEITDIKAWATKHGWSSPKRPTRIPVFPDPPAKQGTYPK